MVAPVRVRAAAPACTRSDGVTQLMYLNRHATRLYKAARTGVRQAGGWEADFFYPFADQTAEEKTICCFRFQAVRQADEETEDKTQI